MNYYNKFDDYMINVIESLKKVLFVRHNDVFDRLDFSNDEIFLEPLLYTYVNQDKDIWFDSIIYGYEKIKKENIIVFSNSEGIIYIPKIGYLKTEQCNQQFTLRTQNSVLNLFLDDESTNHIFEPILYINGIEIVKYQHPLFQNLFTDLGVIETDVVETAFELHLKNIEKALEVIQVCNPDYFNQLKENLKKIFIYNAKKPYSFADMRAHNMIFLNAKKHDNECFFIDHISHEGAHVIFNTMTYETKHNLFKCHYNESFAKVTGEIWEHSTVYLRFHGLFTYLEITKTLENCIIKNCLCAGENREIKGRFVFILSRYKQSLERFMKLDIYTEEGLKWLKLFESHYLRLEKKYSYFLNEFIIADQPYDFDNQIFEAQNPYN